MAEKKMTKREMFTTLIGIVGSLKPSDDAEADLAVALIEGLKHEVALLDKRRATSKGDAKKKAEQTATKSAILSVLAEADEPMRATAIAEAVGVSVQKVTALVRQMVEAGEVVREQDKKVVTFALPDED